MRFAKIIDNIVEEIYVIDPNLTEEAAEQYCIKTFGDDGIYKRFKRTFKDSPSNVGKTDPEDLVSELRGNGPGKGSVYHPEHDVFMPVKPYDNWTMDTTNWKWVAPVAKPNFDNLTQTCEWDEANQQWNVNNI
tara:strand:+ start:98 stop:496 length:399 start_codon:yes stop_codon:yes gene_type:complete